MHPIWGLFGGTLPFPNRKKARKTAIFARELDSGSATISDKPADDLCAAQKGEVGVGVDQRTTDIMCSGLWNEKGQPIAIAMPCEAYRPKPIQRDQPCAKATRHNINGNSKPTTLAAAKEIPVSGAIPMRFSPMRMPAEKTVWAT